MQKRIGRCRISGSPNLLTVLSLGEQCYTGVFPSCRDETVPVGPLELVWCPDSGLLQLAHRFDPLLMYGNNYGYRSGLNTSMVRHLGQKATFLSRYADLQKGDIVIDIGSNDGTLLRAYTTPGLVKVGIDPTGAKFRKYYPNDVLLISDFFTRESYESAANGGKAKLITSIAMFYDLEDPVAFARDVHSCLRDDGVWHFEQSYMPSMLRMNAYDTICHEHVSYYSLSAIENILDAAGFELNDVVMNEVNGGSFAISARKRSPRSSERSPVVNWLLAAEHAIGLHTPRPFRDFEERVFDHRHRLTSLVRELNARGKKILGYGASTKGNVLLQFCGFTSRDIPFIADVNPDKHGHYTPGTGIAIVSEEEVRHMKPDYLLVFPWHFKAGILEREAEYLSQGGHMIFPMPEIEIV
jgi:hypothetical protein